MSNGKYYSLKRNKTIGKKWNNLILDKFSFRLFRSKFKLSILDFIAIFLGLFALVWLIVFSLIFSAEWDNWDNTLSVYFGTGYNFIFFTTQSNLLAAFFTIVFALKKNKWTNNLFFAATVLTTITFIIYWSLISWNIEWGQLLQDDINSTFTHFVFPLFYIVLIKLYSPRIKVTIAGRYFPMVYLFFYYMMATILFAISYNSQVLIDNKQWVSNVNADTQIDTYIEIYSFLNWFRPLHLFSLSNDNGLPNYVNAILILLMQLVIVLLMIGIIFLIQFAVLKLARINHQRLLMSSKSSYKLFKLHNKKFLVQYWKNIKL